MSQSEPMWSRQKHGWTLLRGLHPRAIDLDRIELLRTAELTQLADARCLAELVLALGLNDEAIDELPAALHAHCGQGLRIWQYPHQFSDYLTMLSRLRVRSYLEIGIRHGGSFVATTEYLERFHPLDFAVGVDVIPCPSMPAYEQRNPKAQFWCENTLGPKFRERLDSLHALDLVFIDSHHQEEQCRTEFELLAQRCQMIAFHDVANVGCPGVGRVWQELKLSSAYDCFEFSQQYGQLGPFMGIGLAVKKERMREMVES